MPSLDEHREVAARLRDYIDFDFGDSNPYWYVMKAIYGDVAIHGDNELFNRLADLIEPQQTHICLGCIKWTAIGGNPVKGVCAEFSDPEDGIERATPYYGYCHEWENA